MKSLHRLALLTFTLGLGTALAAQPVCDGTGSRGSCDGSGPHGSCEGSGSRGACELSDSGNCGGHAGYAGKHGKRGGPTFGLMRVLDVDRDHVISAVEIANSASALLTLDRNGDGIVSAAEIHPGHHAAPARATAAPQRSANAPGRPASAPQRSGKSGPPQGEPLSPIMLALDADGDGTLSVTEIANAPASLSALDANGDGMLTPDEFRPLPPTSI
jgi:hypothetical protein